MDIHALIPVKELTHAKSRLMPPLTGDERATLTLTMLRHVIAVARASDVFARITVVSPDARVLDYAAECGAAALMQRTVGLNPALDEARVEAMARDADAVLVLHADLPRLSAEEIVAMVGLLPASSPAAVLAPDYTGSGTNALLLAPPDALPFHFGPDSFTKHIAAAEARHLPYAIARASGIAGDVDTPDDVRERVISGQ